MHIVKETRAGRSPGSDDESQYNLSFLHQSSVSRLREIGEGSKSESAVYPYGLSRQIPDGLLAPAWVPIN